MQLRLSLSWSKHNLASALALAFATTSSWAADATGKVAWVDAKNAALLLECVSEQSCAAIPSAKTGETYTFVIPSSLMGKVAALREGQQVTVSYEDLKEKGYVLTDIK